MQVGDGAYLTAPHVIHCSSAIKEALVGIGVPVSTEAQEKKPFPVRIQLCDCPLMQSIMLSLIF
jgi:hypothetical protein